MTERNPNQSIWVLPVPVSLSLCPMFSVLFRSVPFAWRDLKSCGRKPVRVRFQASAQLLTPVLIGLIGQVVLTLPPETVPARALAFGRNEQEADATQAVQHRANRHQSTPGRGGVGPRSADAPGLQEELGVSEQTSSRWRKEYGGLRLDQAKRLKALEQEHTQLKTLVADQALDNMILKEVASGHF